MSSLCTNMRLTWVHSAESAEKEIDELKGYFGEFGMD